MFCNLCKREFICLYFSLARLVDENKCVYRFHASFSVLRAVSTTRRIMKNSCCESFNIIFEARVMPFPPHFYAKQKLFSRNYSIFFIFAFQEHQKCIFKTSRKRPTILGPTYLNSAGCWNARDWIKSSSIHYEMSGAV